MSHLVTGIFNTFQEYLDKEQEIREEIRNTVRELEQIVREVLTALQTIHQQVGIIQIADTCKKLRIAFTEVKAGYSKLAEKIPKDQYYRFHDHWRFVIQRTSFLAAMLVYLEEERLASHEEVAAIMGVSAERETGFHLDLDDYLMGLLQLSSELSRLTINSVIASDYARPLRISRFMSELNSGFRLLNLKNDSLRKRFDGLKYDVQKVEEVVYDLSIRGLKPPTE